MQVPAVRYIDDFESVIAQGGDEDALTFHIDSKMIEAA